MKENTSYFLFTEYCAFVKLNFEKEMLFFEGNTQLCVLESMLTILQFHCLANLNKSLSRAVLPPQYLQYLSHHWPCLHSFLWLVSRPSTQLLYSPPLLPLKLLSSVSLVWFLHTRLDWCWCLYHCTGVYSVIGYKQTIKTFEMKRKFGQIQIFH